MHYYILKWFNGTVVYLQTVLSTQNDRRGNECVINQHWVENAAR